mmetsp:Transcript_102406/g.330324  ORF Transcript_102406/g.330324 Transcript_102406/m.330324 type:complete len:210 (+) Transcript_102406:983-1612(+)
MEQKERTKKSGEQYGETLCSNQEEGGQRGQRCLHQELNYAQSEAAASHVCIKQKKQEKLVIPEADGVAQPEAVMVHPKHHTIKGPATVGAVWLVALLPLAPAGPMCAALLCPQPRRRLAERPPLCSLRHPAWVRARDPQPAGERQKDERVEDEARRAADADTRCRHVVEHESDIEELDEPYREEHWQVCMQRGAPAAQPLLHRRPAARE